MGRNKKRDDSKLPHQVPPKGQAEEKADDLEQAKRGAGFHHWSHVDGCDIFSMIEDVFGFGDMGRDGLRRQGAQPGANLCCEIDISDNEAARGITKTLQVNRRERCDKCTGSGSASGRGETCATCGGAGRIRKGRGRFSVETDCPKCDGRGTVIGDPCAACRGKGAVEVKRTIEIKIPAGVRDGQRLRCRGAGHTVHTLRRRQGLLKRLANYFRPVAPRGHLYATIHILRHAEDKPGTNKDQSDQPKDKDAP